MLLKRILPICAFLLLFVSCFNDYDDNLSISEEELTEQVPTTELITEGSELFAMLETLSQRLGGENGEHLCIEFIYPFIIKVYDSEGYFQYAQAVENDSEFYILLNQVPQDYNINLSFPIVTELPDGSPYEINTKEELKVIIQDCIEAAQEEALGYCENLTSAPCAWVIDFPEDVDSDVYLNSVFLPAGGFDSYYWRGTRYNSSWIYYFISNKLHLNISLEDDEDVGENWNYDWQLQVVNDSTLHIQNADGKEYLLRRECSKDNYCTTLTFKECEIEDQPGVAEYILENYLTCVETIAEPLDENGNIITDVDFIYSFYLTEIDAENSENEIDQTEPFLNTENPQGIYVRIEHPETEEYIIKTIILIADDCD